MNLLYLILSISFAQECPRDGFTVGPVSFTQMALPSTGCNISASTSSLKTSRRSLRFLKSGQVNVFTEVGDSSKTAGFRSYFILPATSEPMTMKSLGGMGARVHDSSGLDWIFDEQGNVKIEQKCKLTISKTITLQQDSTANGKAGGFDLKSCPNSIIIDSGFKERGNNLENPKALSTIKDSNGNSCSVSNSTLFTYVKSQGTIRPNQAIHAALSKVPECAKLDLSPLSSNSGVSGNKFDSSR